MTDKNNSSAATTEHVPTEDKLFYLHRGEEKLDTPEIQSKAQGIRKPSGTYLPPPSPHGAMPNLDVADKQLQVVQQGYFRAIILPGMKENPAVPIAMGLTVAALALGVRAMMKGDLRRSNIMMRYRVGFQALAVTAMVGTLYVRDRRRKQEAAQEEQFQLKGE